MVQSAKFELVLNAKTHKALHLAIPNTMQLLADEVIKDNILADVRSWQQRTCGLGRTRSQ